MATGAAKVTANVIEFRRPPISKEEYFSAINNKSTLRAVQKELKKTFLSRSDRYHQLTAFIPEISFQKSPSPFGVLYPITGNIGRIATNIKYPNFLINEGLDEGRHKGRSLKLAAASVIAFASLNKWKEELNLPQKEKLIRVGRRTKLGPQYEKFWPETEYIPETGTQSLNMLIQRIAAGNALAVVGLKETDIDFSSPPPVSLHIAGLMDPLMGRKVSVFHDIVYTQ